MRAVVSLSVNPVQVRALRDEPLTSHVPTARQLEELELQVRNSDDQGLAASLPKERTAGTLHDNHVTCRGDAGFTWVLLGTCRVDRSNCTSREVEKLK